MKIKRKIQKIFTILLLIFIFRCFITGKIIEAKEKCKRPNWYTFYDSNFECFMYYNHYILSETSTIKPKIRKKNNFCFVVSGHWIVESFSGYTSIYIASDLNIDHILPYSYIVKQVGCRKAKKYFHIRYNLEPLEAGYNKKKSDKICNNKNYCIRQKDICKRLEKEFNENLNCAML